MNNRFTVTRPLVFTFSLFVLILGFTACKKSSSNSNAPNNTISASITGPAVNTNFNSAETFGIFYNTSHEYWLEGAQIVGGDSLIFDFTFYDTVALNKPYQITDAAGGDINVTLITWKNHSIYAPDYVSPVGTLTLNSVNTSNHQIIGTFSGKFFASQTDSVTIANGKFNIICQVE